MNWGTSVGSVILPARTFIRREQTILKFYTRFSSDGLRIMCTGGGETRHPPDRAQKIRIASQDTGLFEMVTVDAELDWNLQVAHVIATTRDGTEGRKTVVNSNGCRSQCLQLAFLHGPGAHLFGDIDLWYYDMPAPTARRCPLPFAPCRDDELRFDVGACLGDTVIFPGRRAAGCPTTRGIGLGRRRLLA